MAAAAAAATSAAASSPSSTADSTTSDAAATISSPASASPSSLTAEQRAAIESKKAAALSKRKSLLTPLAKTPRAPGDAPLSASGAASTRFHAPGASAAAASAAAFELMSPTSRLSSQLRTKQAAAAKLREQKFIHVDAHKTAETELLTEKWTVAAQEVLTELLAKLQQTRVR